MFDIMGKVKEMQDKMAVLQEELGQRTVTGSSGGGIVTVIATGKMEIVSVSVDKTLLDDSDTSMLEDLVRTAVNDALVKARDMMAEEMRAITGGINIPGLF
ncbi:MAG: Nucleoid-associated protein [Desulfovibrio sp.]